MIWALLVGLESRTGWLPEQASTIADLDLAALERSQPAFEQRTAEQTARLLEVLAHAEDRLRRLYGDAAMLDEPPCVVEAQRIEGVLDAPARNPVIERQTLDLSPWRLRLAGAFNALALRSLVWTLARALVAAAAYALTIYSDTWGSVTDFASAFTAGFLTETVVSWAVMPSFRSNRNRADEGSWLGAIPPVAALVARSEASGANGGTAARGTGDPAPQTRFKRVDRRTS